MANVYDPETEGSQKSRGSGASSSGTGGSKASFSSGSAPSWGKGLGSDSTSASPSELKNDEEKGLYNPGGDKAGNSEGGASDNTGDGQYSNDKLKAKEESPSNSSGNEDDDGGLWNQSSSSNSTGTKKARFAISKKKVAIGGSIASIVVGGSFFGFMSLMPLKTEGLIKLLNRYLTPSESAMQTTADNMLERYVVKHVLPDYKRCGTTLSSKCSVNLTSSSNPVVAVYKDWADNKIETKLATDYGIEFKYNSSSDRWYLKAPGAATQTGDDIGANGEKLTAVFQRTDRAGMRGAFHQALDGETRWKNIHTRFQVGRLLEEKYGIKRCVAFCGKRDQLADFKNDKKNAAQIYLAQRVLQPRNTALGIAIECLSSGSCDAQSTQTTTPQAGSTGELEGTPENPDVEGQIRAQVTALSKTYDITDKDTVDKAVKYAQDIYDKGYDRAALSAVLEKIGLSQITDQVADAVPIIGWVDRISALISSASTMGPNLKKLSYLVGSGSAVSMYMMMRTYADEIHTGHVDATEVGSMTSSLGPGKKVGNNDPVGGTAGAEASPLYRALSGGSTSGAQTSFLGLGGTASAATDPYKCGDNNSSSVPAGSIACPEEVLGQGIGAATSISAFLNAPGMNFISKAAGVIHSPFAAFNKFLGSLFSLVPGVNDLTKVVADAITPAFTWAVNNLIPNPFGNGNLSGGRKFQIGGAGVTVVAQDSCAQIGCQSVDANTYVGIINQQTGEEKIAFSQKSLKDRLFDRESSYSLISRTAMAMPSNPTTSIASLFSNPFNGLLSSLNGVLYGAKASAATTNIPASAANPFKAGTSAYPAGTIPSDPEKYWDDHNCGDTSENGPIALWQKAASDGPKDPDTGMPVHTTTEPCLLIKYTAGAAGAKYNSSLLTPDERDLLNGNAPGSTAPETTAGADIDMAQLFKDSSSVACADNTKDLGTQDGYTGGNKVKIRVCAIPGLPSSGQESHDGFGVSGANGNAVVNSRVSGAVYAMVQAAKKDGVDLTATSSFRTMAHQQSLCPCDGVHVAHPGNSNHQMGLAIDFGGGLPSTPGPISGNQFWEWLSKNADKFGYKNYPAEAWHWSPTGN